jgi:hypothetical protein
MNIPPAQQVPADDPDRPPCLCHDLLDCPEQATVEINAAELAHVAELLDLLDGFLRSGNGIADHLTDYLQKTARDPRTTAPTGRQLQREPGHRPRQLHRSRPAPVAIPTDVTLNSTRPVDGQSQLGSQIMTVVRDTRPVRRDPSR